MTTDIVTVLTILYNQFIMAQSIYQNYVNNAANIQTKTQAQAKVDAYSEVIANVQALILQYGGTPPLPPT